MISSGIYSAHLPLSLCLTDSYLTILTILSTAPNIILSAAHCAPSSTNGILANINNFDLDNPGPNGQNAEEISVSTFRTHPAYDLGTSLSNDFMLLKLSSSSSNPLVRLNSNSNDPQTSDPELTVVGWGTTVEGVNRPPDVLQQVKVEYITNDACKNSYGSRAVSSDMMCCREAGQGSCQGDSGGPLVIKGNDGEGTDVQVGVVSWGFDCALANYPGKYTVPVSFCMVLSTETSARVTLVTIL